MKTTFAHRGHSRQERRRGFTLTEIAIVLGIVGLILGSIWVAAAAVYNNLRSSHGNTEIIQVAQGVRTLMSTSSTVGAAGDLTGAMIAAKLIPADAISSATTATGPWAGSTLKVMTVAATDTAFTVEMNNIPQAGCVSLISTVAGAARDPNLTAVGAKTAAATGPVTAGTAGTALALSNTPLAASVPASTAATACSATDSTNFAQFEFSLK